MKLIFGSLTCLALTVALLSGSAIAADVPDGTPVPGHFTTTWVGNSLAAGDQHIPQHISGIFVQPDGTLSTNTVWDEGGGEVTTFGPDGSLRGIAGHTHGWGYGGGTAISGNNRFFYFVQQVDSEGGHLKDPDTWPRGKDYWFGVSRRLATDITQPAPFDGGKGKHGAVLPKSFLMVTEASVDAIKKFEGHEAGAIDPGIPAIAASATHLYVAVPSASVIDVYDSETMAPTATWKELPRVTAIALTADDQLWIAQSADGANPAAVTLLDNSGKPTARRIALSAGAEPVSLALDSRGRLYVADGGQAQHIEVFDPRDLQGIPTAHLLVIGDSMFDGRGPIVGRIAPGRFSDINAIGLDQADNLYVASGRNGATLEKYDPNGKQLWAKYALTFVDNSSIDPLTGDIYSSEEHYQFDWTKSAPGSEWSYYGKTLDRFRFPQDARNERERSPLMRRLNGNQLYAFASDQYASGIYVYRFDNEQTGETAIPCAAISKGARSFSGAPDSQAIWLDSNGDGNFDATEFSMPKSDARTLGDDTWGWWVDETGDIWQTANGKGPTRGLRHFKIQGFDQRGAPIYTWDAMTAEPAPAPFLQQGNNGLERVVYLPKDDVMFLGGFTQDAQHATIWGSFRVIARYDHWLAGNRQPTWTIQMPWRVDKSAKGQEVPICFAVAGDYLFEVGVTTESRTRVYRIADGSYIGDFTPNNGLFTIDNTGWVDMRPFGVQAIKRPDGSYAVCVEEDYHAKTIIYRWTP